jgi:hypothetical protein
MGGYCHFDGRCAVFNEKRRWRPRAIRMMYVAYGLNMQSCFYLPELPVSTGRRQVCVRHGIVEHSGASLDDTPRGGWVSSSQAWYVMKHAGAFLVSGGEDILVEPFPGASAQFMRLSLLGPAMALLLRQRGEFVLHAGSVGINGAAVAFLGGHGWGKSTLVATLHARGHEFICEDVAGLSFYRGQIQVIPSFPQFKLWPDAAERLGWSPADLPQVHPYSQKRLIQFRDGFSEDRKPLRRLYVLRVGTHVHVERARPVEGLEEILKHWYGARFGPKFLRSLDRPELFRRAAELVRTVPVRVLRRPATLHEDPDLAEAIEREILRDLECPDD